jgi:hypothetical protein
MFRVRTVFAPAAIVPEAGETVPQVDRVELELQVRVEVPELYTVTVVEVLSPTYALVVTVVGLVEIAGPVAKGANTNFTLGRLVEVSVPLNRLVWSTVSLLL